MPLSRTIWIWRRVWWKGLMKTFIRVLVLLCGMATSGVRLMIDDLSWSPRGRRKKGRLRATWREARSMQRLNLDGSQWQNGSSWRQAIISNPDKGIR